MTTINTIEDLVRILDERPEWNEAIRARMLSRELLNLPQTLADFAEQTNRRLAALEMSMEQVVQRQARLEEGQANLVERQARLEEGQANLVERQARLEEGQANLVERQARLEEGQANLERGQARIENDLAPLKAAHARNGALRITRQIARTINCRQSRLVEGGDILDSTDADNTQGIPQNELDSFDAADIIIEGMHRDTGEVHYIAVEVSYTADQRDCDRAIRNAEFLTRFTGQPAHAVISSVRFRPAIEHLIETGAVRWVEILPEVLETD